MRAKVLLTALLPCAVSAIVWPAPSAISTGNNTLWIQPNVVFQHHVGPANKSHHEERSERVLGNPLYSPPTCGEIVGFAISRSRSLLFDTNYVPWRFFERGTDFEPADDGSQKVVIERVVLWQSGPDPIDIIKTTDYLDESYNLTVGTDGKVLIKATTSIGLSRGLSTFVQLFYLHSSKKTVYTNVAPVAISDKPVYSHRGLNLDIARSFIPVETIKRTIDALAFSKGNRLHLHAIDSQSWPLIVPTMPELAEKGAYHPSQTYTPDDIAGIQRYAALQGVQTIIEIELPGHTTSIGFSHPDLIAAFKAEPWMKYANEPPAGTLKLNHDPVDEFVEKLFDDLLPRLSTYSTYFHTGGDEVNVMAYSLDPTVRSNDTAVIKPFLERFLIRAHDKIRSYGMTPMVWEEMIGDWDLNLGKDILVQAWKSADAALKVVNKGYKTIVGDYNVWYLDCGRGQWVDTPPGLESKYAPYLDYCSPSKNWRLAYSYNPRSGIPTDKHDLIVGGEAHVWTEQTDESNLDATLWPRVAAIQEVLWSGHVDPMTKTTRSFLDVSDRLARFRERLVLMGVASEPVYMSWCSMNKDCFWTS